MLLAMQHILTANEVAALMASAHRPNFVLQVHRLPMAWPVSVC